MTPTDLDTEQSAAADENVPASAEDSGVGERALKIPDDAMIILPVRNAVLFPSVVMPLAIGRPGSIAAALSASRGEHELGVLLQHDPTTDTPAGEDLHRIGTASAVLRYVTTGDGSHHLIVQGLERFRVRDYLPGFDFLVARIDLSCVTFIATANVLDAIPGPLRDRMEVIELPGYTQEEKLAIAQRFLLARQIVATGLAWTAVGGDILFIEASRVPGKGRLILTGQLGDVMKESAQAALSLVKGRVGQLNLEPTLFERSDVHIHVPAGAIPKDGPSAGVTMFVALVSLLNGRTVHSDVAMTGEISLRGLVLPVGGIKEKVLAAARAGIGTVLLPARNRKDLPDIPAHVQERLRFVWLETVDQAIEVALSGADNPPGGKPTPPPD